MSGRRTKPRVEGKTVMKTFRIPKDIDLVLGEAAREGNRSVTDQYVSVLRNYVKYERLAHKFGFASVTKATLSALFEALPEKELREVAASQSIRVQALAEFWFRRDDPDAIMQIIDLFSNYGGLFEYTVTRTDSELVITMRTELGRKGAIFIAAFWERAFSQAVGTVKKTEIVENQVTLWVDTSSPPKAPR
jgi:hypothetical protein